MKNNRTGEDLDRRLLLAFNDYRRAALGGGHPVRVTAGRFAFYAMGYTGGEADRVCIAERRRRRGRRERWVKARTTPEAIDALAEARGGR